MEQINLDKKLELLMNPTSKQVTDSLKSIVREQLCELHFLMSNRFDDLAEKVTLIDQRCSSLSDKILSSVNEAKMNIRSSEGGNDMKTSPVQNCYVSDLCSSISLPGVRYVAGGEPTLHKLLWMFIHIVTVFISTTYIYDAFNDWQNSPIIQSLTFTKAKDIPFPGVTVCEPMSLKDEYNQSEVLERCLSLEKKATWLCSEEELKMLRVSIDIRPMEFIVNGSDWYMYEEMFKLYSVITDYSALLLPENSDRGWLSGKEYSKYVNKLAKERVSTLRIFNKELNPNLDQLFTLSDSISTKILLPSMYNGGFLICQTFNGVKAGLKEQNTKYETNNVSSYGFRKASVCKPEKMLENACKSELLYTENDLYVEFDIVDFSPNNTQEALFDPSKYQPIKISYIFIHNPTDYPYRNLNTEFEFMLLYHYEKELIINPKFINARKDLTEVDVSKRDCIFSFEKTLSLFEFYSYQNCILECQINCSLGKCGCVPQSVGIFSSFSVCDYKTSYDCNPKSNDFLQPWNYNKDNRCPCECPRDCVSLSYEVKLLSEVKTRLSRSSFTIKYKEPEFVSTFRYSVTSPAEFAAYSLGILGVFNGFSVMFVWEIMYWLSLRLWFTVKRTFHMQN